MQIDVYDGEHFLRSRGWKIFVSVFFGVICLVTLFGAQLFGGQSDNWLPTWGSIFSVALMLGLFYAYKKFAIDTSNTVVSMQVGDQGIQIGQKLYQRHAVQGFTLEVDIEAERVHNFVLLAEHRHIIHTFAADQDSIRSFVQALAEMIPLEDGFVQTGMEKVMRRLKI